MSRTSRRQIEYDDALAAFSVRDYARWLVSGIKCFFRITPLPAVFGPADSFPMAKAYIGRNEFDLAADLSDLYSDLPAFAQSRFEQALDVIWSELDFDRNYEFVIGDNVLTLACRIRAKGLTEVLPSAIPKLRAQLAAETRAADARRLQEAIFQTAMELCSGTAQSVRILMVLLAEQRADPRSAYLPCGRSADHFLYMARLFPHLLDIWFIVFAVAMRSDLEREQSQASRYMGRFYKILGRERVDEAVAQIRSGDSASSELGSAIASETALREAVELLGWLNPWSAKNSSDMLSIEEIRAACLMKVAG